jgi:hypothetical protein
VSIQQHNRGLWDITNPIFDPQRKKRQIVRRRVYGSAPIKLLHRLHAPHFEFDVAFPSPVRVQRRALASDFLLDAIEVLACLFYGRCARYVEGDRSLSTSHQDHLGIMAG